MRSSGSWGRGPLAWCIRFMTGSARSGWRLKVLKRLDAARVYAFKREFRALTGLVHDNLVKLYELVQTRS